MAKTKSGQDGPCSFDNQVTVGDGTFVTSGAWRDEGCTGAGGPYNSGSIQTTCSWTTPPPYLQPGTELALTANCRSTAHQTGGGREGGGYVSMWLTAHPLADCPTCRVSWSAQFLTDTRASGNSADFPVSASQTGSFSVPDGAQDDVLAIVAAGSGFGGSGGVAYRYVYGAAATPPERASESDQVVLPPTETPAPPPQEPQPTKPSKKQLPSYGPVVFSSEYDDETVQPVNPGTEFPVGIKVLYADWKYRGVKAGTNYEYEWYLDGNLVESTGNSLVNAAGHTYDFITMDPGAQQPLDPGTYRYVASINGQVILSAECVVH